MVSLKCPVCKKSMREMHGMKGTYTCTDRNCSSGMYALKPKYKKKRKKSSFFGLF